MSTYAMDRRSDREDVPREAERLRDEEIAMRRGGEIRELDHYDRPGRAPAPEPGPYAALDDDEAPASGPRAPRDFAGRGPRGYRRSDARIEEDICERLTDDAYVDASDITVTVEDGEVTLSGTVDSRRAKVFAEQLCDAVRGVRDVQNRLRVKERAIPGDERPSQSVPPRSGSFPDRRS